MPTIQHIAELFILDERDFITVAYRTLLGREPDPVGMNYYLGRLRMGYGKASIIVQLAKSSEALPHSNIKGLAKLIKEEARTNHWFWGIFTSRQRTERFMQKNIDELMRLMSGIATTIQTIPNVIDARVQSAQHIPDTATRNSKISTAVQPILSQTIIFKNAPANKVIEQLAGLLINSKEAQQLTPHIDQ